MKRALIVTILFLSCSVGTACADIEQIKVAILKKDYPAVKQLAEEILTFAVVEKSLASETRYYLGVSQLYLEKFNQARKNFKQVIKEKPVVQIRDRAYLGLFDVDYLQGNYKEALKTIKKLRKISPKTQYLSLVYLKTARVYIKLAYWNKSREYLNKILDKFPNSLEYHIAQQLLEEKQFFAVQIGAFLDQKRAEQLTLQLKEKDEYAYIIETLDRKNQKFYRVRVGQMTRLSDAQELKGKLAKEGYPTQIYP